LGFGLTVRRRPQADIQQRVAAVADSLGLADLLDRKPGQLSGGQRQRVALGRAIVREPLAFLFDEPLSNLDARLRVETRAELARIHDRLGATMVYVTHDQVEAMTLGTRVAVMHEGALQQVAPPMDLYRAPATHFVAGFIGSPGMTFVDGVVRRRDGASVFEGSGLSLGLDLRAAAIEDGHRVVLGVRPQAMSIAGVAGGDGARDGGAPSDRTGRVWLVEALGSEQIIHVALGGVRDLVVVAPSEPLLRQGAVVRVRVPAAAVHLFDASSGARLHA